MAMDNPDLQSLDAVPLPLIDAILRSLSAGLLVLDRELRYRYWGSFMETLSGLPADRVLGQLALELFPHLRERGIDVLYRRALAGEHVTSRPTPYRVPASGISGHVKGSYHPLVLGTGAIGGVIAIVQDVGPHHATVEELRQREVLLTAITDSVADFIFTKDTEHRYTFVNRAMCQLFGVSADQLIGRTPPELFDPASAALVSEADDQAYAGQVTDLIRSLPFGDRVLTFHTVQVPLRDETGRIDGICGIVRDVTEREQTKQALRESEERFRLVMENIPEILWLLELSEPPRMHYVSPAYDRISGRDRAELLATPGLWLTLVHPEDRDRVAEHHEQLRGDHGHEPPEPSSYRILRPDGEVRWLRERAFRMPGGQAGSRLIGGMVEDITEQRRFEQQRQHAEKMEAIGQLVSGIAHDFNNLLGSILGFSELIHKELHDPRLRDYSDSVCTAAARAAELTSQLLRFARRSEGAQVLVDVHGLIQELCLLLERSLPPGIQVSLRLEAENPNTRGDPSQLQSALLNLCLNARDAIPESGTITIRTHPITVTDQQLTGFVEPPIPGDYLAISVRDDGVGIDAAQQHRIFEPFFTTKAHGQGTGLGLSTVLGTIGTHRGAIRLDSAPGKGTEVLVLLPQHRGTAPLDHQQVRTQAEGRVARVLIVDDDPALRRLASDILSAAGHQVVCARDGLEAIERLRATPGGFELVLLDLLMPNLGGREALPELLAIQPDLRVLICTGHGSAATMAELLGPRVSLLLKPYRPRALTQAVATLLEPRTCTGPADD